MLAEEIIKTALNEVLENLSLSVDWAPENTQIDWNLQKPFIRSYDGPLGKKQASFGTTGANAHIGIFHIDVCFPGNAGSIKPLAIAEEILPNYKRGTDLYYDSNLIRCEKSEIRQAYVENSWYILPIWVTYRAYMEN